MAYERIGATGDSVRVRNNDWFIYRSVNGNTDIKVFRVNTLDQIEFFTVPNVGGDSFVLESQFEALEERVTILEQIVESISAGNINIFPVTLTPAIISAKSITLPQTPISGKAVMFPATGIPQLVGPDFGVTGNVLDWDGYELESQLADGDIIKVIYMF